MDESNASISTQFASVNKRIDESNASIGTQFAAVNKRMDESNAILTQVLSALLPKAAAEKQK